MLVDNLRANYIKNYGETKETSHFYAEKVQASEKVRIDINRSNLSLLCIYFLTGDKLFYEQNRQKIINIIAKYNYKNT